MRTAQKIESMVNDEIDKKKDGSLAFTDNTNVKQNFKLNAHAVAIFIDTAHAGNTTVTNIENRMKMSLNTYMVQKDENTQLIRKLKVPAPCGAPLNITPAPTDAHRPVGRRRTRAWRR